MARFMGHTMFTEEQKKLIRDTWEPVTADFTTYGVVIFGKIFEIDPDIAQLFSSRFGVSTDELKECDQLKVHATGVMETVNVAVRNVDNPGVLDSVLVNLGLKHKSYGVQEKYFGPVAQAVLWGLGVVNGDKFTEAAKDAWVMLYTFVQEYMVQGMRNEHLNEFRDNHDDVFEIK